MLGEKGSYTEGFGSMYARPLKVLYLLSRGGCWRWRAASVEAQRGAWIGDEGSGCWARRAHLTATEFCYERRRVEERMAVDATIRVLILIKIEPRKRSALNHPKPVISVAGRLNELSL